MTRALFDPAVAGYIAGLIDGEGTITLTRVHRNENRRLVRPTFSVHPNNLVSTILRVVLFQLRAKSWTALRG